MTPAPPAHSQADPSMPLTLVASLVPAALVLAGTLGLTGDAPRAPTAADLYCTGSLCQ